jgi:hypothetical protein
MPWKFGNSNDPEAGNGHGVEVQGEPPKKSDAELLAETVSAALKPLQDAMTEIKTKQDSFEQRFAKPADKSGEGGEANRVQFASVFEDEDAAINQRVMAAVGPIMQGQLEMQAQMNRERVWKKYEQKGFGPTLSQFVDRINQLIDAKPLVVANGQGGWKACRGDVAEIEASINQVLGEAAAQAGLRFDGKSKSFFIESANGGDGSSVSSSAGDGLTDQQRKMFGKMGVPVAEAQKTISKLKFIS